jgi:heme/copper-type cytochrome/quinol oxidase subunit 2
MSVRRRLRERQLAGDGRTGRFARSQARRAQQDYLKRKWLVHVVVTAVVCAIIIAISMTLSSAYLRGLTVGIGCTAFIAMQWTWVIQYTGTAGLLMGEQAELFTADLLRKQRGWRLVNHVNLRKADIDHVFFGADGIYAIETKWSSSIWSPERLAAAADQAARNARDLTIWSPLKRFGPTRALLILWGPTTAELVTPTSVNGVPVIAGKEFDDWWQHHPTRDTPLNSADLDTIWNELSARCDVMDPDQPDKPPSLLSVVGFAAALVTLGVLGQLVAIQALAHLPLAAAAAICVVSALAGLMIRPWLDYPARHLATAWTTGATAGVAIMLAALATY